MADKTKELTVDEKLDWLISEFAQMKTELGEVKSTVVSIGTRLTTLEERVEDRIKDTRPIWQAIHAQTEKIIEDVAQLKEGLARVEARQVVFEEKMDTLIDQIDVLKTDVIEVRAAQNKLKKRVVVLEQSALEQKAA